MTLFQYCPHCAHKGFLPTESNAYTCDACGFHYHHNIASAAGALLQDDQGRILFVRRAKNPHQGKLGIPGGFVSPGESAEETVRREVEEELGLQLGPLQYLASFPNVYPYRGIDYQVLDLYFTGRVPSLEKVVTSDEIAGYVLLPLAEVRLEDLAFDSLRAALQYLVRPNRM